MVLTVASASCVGVAARPADADAPQVLSFLDALDEHEDVQRVFSNADFDDAQLEALA